MSLKKITSCEGEKTMGKANSDEEILKFAIVRENEAHNFFLALASRVKEPHIRKLFEDLAAEELEHKEKLELEIIKTGKTISTEQQPPRPTSEYIISDDPSQLDIDYKDVLLLGMEKEEASFRIYVNLIPDVHDEQSREVLLALAEEEVKHKLRFETEYNMLLKKS
jgi:rubrerythrin